MKQIHRAEFVANIEINGKTLNLWTSLGLYKDWYSAYDSLTRARKCGYETRVVSEWVPSGQIIQYENEQEKETMRGDEE